MKKEQFYDAIVQIYQADVENKTFPPNLDFEPVMKHAQDMLVAYLEQNPQSDEWIIDHNFIQRGKRCCDSQVTIPYFYWSEYAWNKLATLSFPEQVAMLNLLPCLTCRDHSQAYIDVENQTFDLEGCKVSVEST